LIDPQSGQVLAPFRVVVPQKLQGIDVGWIPFHNPFQETYFDVQIALFLPR
jgi:hypothetical protein